jgi:hypothetical protein
MARKFSLLRYLSNLTPGKVALWCYLIWYLVTVTRHFDSSPRLWLSSLACLPDFPDAILRFQLLRAHQGTKTKFSSCHRNRWNYSFQSACARLLYCLSSA